MSAVNVTIQKSERAVELVVHVDELKSYLGDAPAAWVIGDLLDVTGEAHAESPASSHFTRGDTPASPDGTDVECEHGVQNIPYSVGNPSMPRTGREGSWERGTYQDIPSGDGRPTRMHRPPVHLCDDHCITITSVNVSVESWYRMSRTDESARTEESVENAPRRQLFPAEAVTMAPEEETLTQLSPATNEMKTAVGTDSVVRPTISTI